MKELSEVLHTKFKENPYKNFGPRHLSGESADLSKENEEYLKNLHNVSPDDNEKRSVQRYTESKDSMALSAHILRKYGKEPRLKFKVPDDERKKELDDHVQNINSFIKKQPALTEPVSVFSGVGTRRSSGIKKGVILHLPSFTSTSVNFATANGFKSNTLPDDSRKSQNNYRYHILHFKLPKGYQKGAYIAPHSKIKGEREYLLSPDQKWKVTGRQSFKTPHNNEYTHVWDLEPHED